MADEACVRAEYGEQGILENPTVGLRRSEWLYVIDDLGTGPDAVHTRQCPSVRNVDLSDSSVRHLGSHETNVHLTGNVDVVDVTPASGEQAFVFASGELHRPTLPSV